MAQQCFHSEYFDSLLHACKPCHLRCSNPPATCQPYCDPRSAQLDKADTELTRIRAGDDRIFPRSLEYTVEECTCEDCVKSKPKGDSDHFFPLPAMEEGATILVTTKTGDYGKSSVPTALQSVMGMEKPTHTR
ncbi:tumor necrosis factor receptor superfamily member 17 isoform X2 [Mus musculus]|uniref:tumor necrosis factor receptor superfamily member 17 isoform X2 n=1 Tax=Mus musculus TaxID=10090 RepID=UPI0003D7101C|nr:tumor necrosis factor receptor superfamily member 17 isoform X2 [Mus musculus]|eukprot:XP_006522053.1 PREDICTED: tumor necrosis factor receptor superfamily member 17 isoform X2 [Mus musculus]